MGINPQSQKKYTVNCSGRNKAKQNKKINVFKLRIC